jgi:hypothetical protein
MTEQQKHLSSDLRALRYLDAQDAGDLEAVSALWEEASRDPELERMLTELDGAMFQAIQGNPTVLRGQAGRRRRRWVAWGGAVGTMAAASLLAFLSWPPRDQPLQGPNPPTHHSRPGDGHQTENLAQDFSPLLTARRDMDEAALPTFVWPLENLLSASTPLDRLDGE